MKTLLVSILFFTVLIANAQCTPDIALAYQQQLTKEYADPDKTPLTEEDLKTFTGLNFYPVDINYCVTATFKKTPNEKPFGMATTTDRKPQYVKYGEATFTLNGKLCKVDVFQSLDMVNIEKYKDALFLPFTDVTSGEGSYAGGRYVDLVKPDRYTLVIDFNTAYNPYCVYNHSYSCSIPPSQNYIDVAIKAGVKDYNKK